MSGHESLSLCPFLRSGQCTHKHTHTHTRIQTQTLSINSQMVRSPLSPTVELVKAADIKVIAALGDSMTVSCIYLYSFDTYFMIRQFLSLNLLRDTFFVLQRGCDVCVSSLSVASVSLKDLFC